MALAAGTRLGPYEILAPLGAGGMGEVYRARDTKLDRAVAIKLLPRSFAEDPERVARFRREAQLLAALNHPHIAAIHGLEEADGSPFLVLELVDGESLADRLKRGPIPVAEAIPIARQIAEALADAHDKGIIHRDLKPSNIALADGDQVKVLDFGLAKLAAPGGGAGSSVLSVSPTITTPALNTGVGTLLGTAAYMAPEQAKGRDADKRCDVWAFGCVLFEMLTGQQAFAGEDVLDTLTAIMRGEPDWNALPSDVPDHLRTLIKRCLVKDRRQRITDISVALYIMNEGAPASAQALPPPQAIVPRARLAGIAAGAAFGGALLTAVVAWIVTRPAPQPPERLTRFAIVPSTAQPLSISGSDHDIAISPDGSHVVYRSGTALGQLVLRRLDQLETQVLTGVSNARGPFFSPDGHWIGFFDGAELKKVSITGGPAIALCRITGAARGASWGDDNTIVFATTDPTTGLLSVPAGGGDAKVLTRPDAAQRELDHVLPSVLPGGRGVLFSIPAGNVENQQIAILDLRTGQTKVLIRGGSDAKYIETGHLVYAASGTLRAVRFDLARLEVVGDPGPIVDHLGVSPSGAASYGISRNGTLVYVPGSGSSQATRQLVWVDRKGQEEPVQAPLRAYVVPRLSPDGSRVALEIRDQESDIWIWDLARRTLTRLTFDPAIDLLPVWTPDSRRIIFGSARTGTQNLYWHAADGTGGDERLTTSANVQGATSVTPDGTYIIGFEVFPKTIPDIVRIPLGDRASNPATGAQAQPAQRPSEVLVQTPYAEFNAEISPDGRFLAYQSSESGQIEVYVRPYPKVNDGRWQVSTGGGTRPAWARDGRELFFVDLTNTLMSVSVQTSGSTFSAGTPAKVFDTKYAMPVVFRGYDISPDGRRFLMIKEGTSDEKATPASLVVVERWFDELKQRVPVP
jgi:serine/threonine-protein kinase